MSNILIIGGSQGIGFQIANKLSVNHQVTAVSRNGNDMLDASIKQVKMDVLIETFVYDEDVLDGIVYCPGTINLKPFGRLTETDFKVDFEINVLGAIKVIQANIAALKKSNQASIVLFSSVAVSQGMPFHASVAASKGAIEALSRSLAAEFAPLIRVNTIAPSVTNTPLAAKLLSSEDKIQKSGERHPLKRIGNVEDIASMALFLLSTDSSWITGQTFNVDGGMSTLKSF
jgi:3-oxoacyl-[acyl-carrier protein] reductase